MMGLSWPRNDNGAAGTALAIMGEGNSAMGIFQNMLGGAKETDEQPDDSPQTSVENAQAASETSTDPTPSQPDDSSNGNVTDAARNDATNTLSNGAPAEIPLIKDLPKPAPELGYERYAETLASLVCGGKTAVDNTPLTIGLFAPWGSGKSTLLKGLEQKIKDDPRHRSIVVNFNAWHHATSQNLAPRRGRR